jgi:uncharacterized repeat protein (TIGR01451 family)
MKRLLPFVIALIATAFAQGPVTITTDIFLVSQVTRDDGTREERFTPATEARPGQVIEYRLSVRNVTSDETLPSGIVVITAPVPEGTMFIANSATPSSELVLTEYSIDFGVTQMEEPLIVGSGDARRVAAPNEYTTIVWTIRGDLEPGMMVVLVYRVAIR